MRARVGRREAMRALLALPAALCLREEDAAAAAATSSARPDGPSPAPAPAMAVEGGSKAASGPFPELAAGKTVGRCTIVRVRSVVAGAVPVTMKSRDGTEFEVDVLRFDPDTPGIARAGSLDVFLKNGGSGDTSTVEEHGLAAMALARWLARREARGYAVPELLTLRQRAPLLAAGGV